MTVACDGAGAQALGCYIETGDVSHHTTPAHTQLQVLLYLYTRAWDNWKIGLLFWKIRLSFQLFWKIRLQGPNPNPVTLTQLLQHAHAVYTSAYCVEV
jgi:hypothetical protein